MEKTKNQHYVPRMYIKRFGYGTKDKPRISVLKIHENIILNNQNPENFASKKYFYDTTEDVIEKILEKDLTVFPSIKESKGYHDEQLAEHTLSRLESEYKKLLDIIEENPYKIYEDKYKAQFICFVHELAYRTRNFRDTMDEIYDKTKSFLGELCDDMGYDEEVKKRTIEENCVPGMNMQLENILSIAPSLKTMKKLLENYDWFIGHNKTELDFIISDDPAKTVWLGFNDICIPVSKKLAIVMRVKLKDAPMISIDKAQGKEIFMSMKGVISYNLLQVSMAQMYAFGSEQAVNFMKNISTLVNMY